MRRWVGWAVFTLSAVLAMGAMVRVELVSGGTLTGDIAEVAGGYSLRTDDGLVLLRTEEVARIDPLTAPPIPAEYDRRFRALDADDVEGHVDLLVWLIERDAWPLAAQQCQTILRRSPNHRLARRWWPRLEPHLPETEQTLPRQRRRELEQPSRPAAPETPLMSDRDVNRLKMYELAPPGASARPPRMRVRDGVDWALINTQIEAAIARDDDEEGTQVQAYLDSSTAERLYTIVEKTGLRFADELEVLGDPLPLDLFRRGVLPLVRETCGRSGCHGATGDAAAFRLPRTSGTGDAGAYAAFYLLNALETDAGPLINRTSPLESPLIHYMIRPDVATYHHPPVPRGQRLHYPINQPSDPHFVLLRKWIASLKQPRPDYELDYDPPLPVRVEGPPATLIPTGE